MIPHIRRINRQGTTAPGVTSSSVRARGFSPRFARTSDFNEGNVNWTALAGAALGGLAGMAAKNRRETYVEEAGLDAQFAQEAGELGKQAAVDAAAKEGYTEKFIEGITNESAPGSTSREYAKLRREGRAHETAEFQLQARMTAGADIARDIEVRAQELINQSRMATEAMNAESSVATHAPDVEGSYARATAEVTSKLDPSVAASPVMMRTIRTQLEQYRVDSENRINEEIAEKNAQQFTDRVANSNADILVNATLAGEDTDWDKTMSDFSAQSNNMRTEGGFKELVSDSISRAMNRLAPEQRLELVDRLRGATLGGAKVADNGELMGFLEQTENNALAAADAKAELEERRHQRRVRELDREYTDDYKFRLDEVKAQDLSSLEGDPVSIQAKVHEIIKEVRGNDTLQDWEKAHIITGVRKHNATISGVNLGEGTIPDSPVVAQHVSNLIAENRHDDAMNYLNNVTMGDNVLRKDLKNLVAESRDTSPYSSQHKTALGITTATMKQMEGRGFDGMAGQIRQDLVNEHAKAVAEANDLVTDGRQAGKPEAQIQQEVNDYWQKKDAEITELRSRKLTELEEAVSDETMQAHSAANRGEALQRGDYQNLSNSEFNTLALSAQETRQRIDETKLTSLNGRQNLLTASVRATLEEQGVDLTSANGNVQLLAVTEGLTNRISDRAEQLFKESMASPEPGTSAKAEMARAVQAATAEVLQAEGTLTPAEIEGLQRGGEAQQTAIEIGQTRSRKAQERQTVRETVEGAQRVYKSPELGEAVFNANEAKNPKKLGRALRTQKRQAIAAIWKNGFQRDSWWSVAARWAPEEGDQEALRQAVAAHGFTVDDAINGSVLVEIDANLIQTLPGEEYNGRSKSLTISPETDLESVRMFESRADFDAFTARGFDNEGETFTVRKGTQAAKLQDIYNMSDEEMEDWVVAQESYLSQAEGGDPSGAPESPPEPPEDQPDPEVTEEPEVPETASEAASEADRKARVENMRARTRRRDETREKMEQDAREAQEVEEATQKTKDLADRVETAVDKIDAALAEDDTPEDDTPKESPPKKRRKEGPPTRAEVMKKRKNEEESN